MKNLYALSFLIFIAAATVRAESCELTCDYDEFFGGGWIATDPSQCSENDSYCADTAGSSESCLIESDAGKTMQGECVTITPPPPPKK